MNSKSAPKLPPVLSFRSDPSQLEVEFSVITPVFGGGVHIDPSRPHQKQLDRRTPIRGATIRGQLRFWWRATVGCRLESHAQMLERETEIWGNASRPGSVKIRISRQPELGAEEAVYRTVETNSGGYRAQGIDIDIAYGAFSLQPQSEHLRSGDPLLRQGGKLRHLSGRTTMVLSFAEAHRADVEAGLRAWAAFGGVGGRTRRGFGAVSHAPLSPEQLQRLVSPPTQTLPMVPSTAGARAVVANVECTSANEALKHGLSKLQRLRQGPGLGRNPGAEDKPNRPGRSRWPEPELIRQLTGRSDPRHRDRFVRVDKMPRWRFGMPIVFHFQNDNIEPRDTELRPRDYERMASPLIIRPFKKPNGRFGCLALVLSVPGSDVPLVLKKAPGDPSVRGDLTKSEAQKIRPLDGALDPLQAFLNYFQQ